MSIHDEATWGVDPAGLAAWLVATGEAVREPITLSRIGQGQSNLILRVHDAAGHVWVLRRPPFGELLATAHDVVREHRVMEALQGSVGSVPPIVGLIQDPAVCSAPCLAMQFVEGNVVEDEAAAEAMSVGARRTLGYGLVELLVQLHDVDPERVGLEGLASRRAYAERQLHTWANQWERSRPSGPHSLDDLTNRLRRAVPHHEERRVVHGDLHLRNVICSPTGAVRATLDWELSTLGDPLADLGTLLAYWPQAGDRPTKIFSASTFDGFPRRDELVEAYAVKSGRDVTNVGFWHVLGLWKVAIIVQGVLRRVENQPKNRAEGAPEGQEDVDAIAMRAVDAATEVGL